jgi:ABC-type dipeptide/oligopeptide/nickel transport system permease subunit
MSGEGGWPHCQGRRRATLAPTLILAIIALALVRASLGGEALGRLAVPLLVLVIGLAEWPDLAGTARAATLLEAAKDHVPRALSAQATRPSSDGISCPISSRR